jgi:hypothetical protein
MCLRSLEVPLVYWQTRDYLANPEWTLPHRFQFRPQLLPMLKHSFLELVRKMKNNRLIRSIVYLAYRHLQWRAGHLLIIIHLPPLGNSPHFQRVHLDKSINRMVHHFWEIFQIKALTICKGEKTAFLNELEYSHYSQLLSYWTRKL